MDSEGAMHFLESILVIILSFLLLIPIISISQYLKSKFELLSRINEDLKTEVNILEICNQEQNIENLLNKVIEFLNSKGVKWLSIEIFSEEHGRIIITNGILYESEEQARCVRVLKITSKDVLYITIRIEND